MCPMAAFDSATLGCLENKQKHFDFDKESDKELDKGFDKEFDMETGRRPLGQVAERDRPPITWQSTPARVRVRYQRHNFDSRYNLGN